MYEIRPNLPGPDMLQLYGLGTPMSVSQVWIEVNPPMPSNPQRLIMFSTSQPSAIFFLDVYIFLFFCPIFCEVSFTVSCISAETAS